MIFVGVLLFFAFLFGCMVLAGLAGGLSAQLTRNPFLWAVATLLACLLLQVAYLFACNLLRCLWVRAEDAPPYWGRVARDAFDCLRFGAMFGAIGWVWCLKRAGHFLSDSPTP